MVWLFSFCSCYRAENIPDNAKPVYYVNIEADIYSVDSPHILTFNDTGYGGFIVDFQLISGNPTNYPLKCYLTGLPPGLIDSPSSVTTELPNQISLAFWGRTDTGHYRFNLNVASPTDTTKYPFILHVMAPPTPFDCATCFVRYWYAVNMCNNDSCYPVVSLLPGNPGWVSISNFACLGDSIAVNAHVSCTSGITIPVQTSHGYTIYGSSPVVPCGTAIAFSLQDTIVYNGDTVACGFWLRSW